MVRTCRRKYLEREKYRPGRSSILLPYVMCMCFPHKRRNSMSVTPHMGWFCVDGKIFKKTLYFHRFDVKRLDGTSHWLIFVIQLWGTCWIPSVVKKFRTLVFSNFSVTSEWQMIGRGYEFAGLFEEWYLKFSSNLVKLPKLPSLRHLRSWRLKEISSSSFSQTWILE